jgi:hypothetical protein
LKRTYENVSGSALEIHSELWERLGIFRLSQAQDYSAERVKNTLVRLPDQNPELVWPSIKPKIQRHAAAEVGAAMKADHVRKFRWAPNYGERTWTLLLVPVHSTYYTDDSGQLQPVLVQAQSGQVDGVRKSSMKRAQRLTVILALIALAGFILSLALGALGMIIPPLLIASVIGGVISAGVGIGAFIPMLRSWRFNLRHNRHLRSIPST